MANPETARPTSPCQMCGQMCPPSSRKQRSYCGDECGELARVLRRAATLIKQVRPKCTPKAAALLEGQLWERECIECSEEFVASNKRHVACSSQCRRDRSVRLRGKTPKPRADFDDEPTLAQNADGTFGRID